MNRQTEKEGESLRDKQNRVVEHMGLICHMAQQMNEYIPKEMPWEDVLQYGCIGLIEAMKRYEDGKGKFATFAGIHIYGSIMEGIFHFLGVKRRRKKAGPSLQSLRSGNSKVIQNVYEGIWQKDVEAEDWIERIEERLSLRKALLSLKPEERELIDAYYFQRKTWAEYAQEKFVDIEWVYLMHRRILKKLRKWLKS